MGLSLHTFWNLIDRNRMIKNAENPEACPKFQDPQAAATDVGNSHAHFAENNTVSRHAKNQFLFYRIIKFFDV